MLSSWRSVLGFVSLSAGISARYGLTTVERKSVGPCGSWTLQVSPSILRRVYGPAQWPAWPVSLRQTRRGERKGRSWISAVEGPFLRRRASATWCSALIFAISFILHSLLNCHCTDGNRWGRWVQFRHAPKGAEN